MSNTHSELIEKIPDKWGNVKVFISNLHNPIYCEIRNDSLIIDEIDVLDKQYLIEIDLKHQLIEFTDDLVDLMRAKDCFNYQDNGDWEKDIELLKSELNEIGFKMANTGSGGNDDYIWYKLSIKTDDFTEKKLLLATKLWSEFNTEKRKLLELIR